MQYRVTHRCGHTETVRLTGPGRQREAIIRSRAQRPCLQCLNTITAARAHAQIEERDLPELTGTPAQVSWAERCRYHALLLLDRVLADAERKPERIPVPRGGRLPGEDDPLLGELIDRLYREDRARFWINYGRDAQFAGQCIIRDGMEVNPSETEIVALLLLAVAGIDDPSPKHIAWVQTLLRPGAAALRTATAGATLDAYVASAMAIIERALRGKMRPYVAVSSGKDSAAVAALVRAVRPDATLHWTDDELEYPETVAMMERMRADEGARLVVSLGRSRHAGWFTPWADRPYWRDPLPGAHRKTAPADDWMAARGHDVTFLGTRAVESRVRAQWFEANGPLYRVAGGTGLRCCPIWDWPTDYVYQWLDAAGITINPVYQRLAAIGVELERRRVGPLPLVPRDILINGWPDLLGRLEARYGDHWD